MTPGSAESSLSPPQKFSNPAYAFAIRAYNQLRKPSPMSTNVHERPPESREKLDQRRIFW
jgi:hypothetical protein